MIDQKQLIHQIIDYQKREEEIVNFIISENSKLYEINIFILLLQMHNEQSLNLLSSNNLKAINNLSNQDFWFINGSLHEIIPFINCKVEEVIDLVSLLVNKAGHDMAAHFPNLKFVSWCKNHYEQTIDFIKNAEDLDDCYLNYIPFAIEALEASQAAHDLLKSSSEKIRQIALRSFGRLPQIDEATGEKIIDICLKQLALADTEESQTLTIIDTAVRIWDKMPPSNSYKQEEILKVIFTKDIPSEINYLLNIISAFKNSLAEGNCNLLIDLLGKAKSTMPNTLEQFDNLLRDETKNWKFENVVKIFEAHIIKSDNIIEAEELYNFRDLVWKNHNNASLLFSKWLENGNPNLCEFLYEMLPVDIDNDITVEIDSTDLPMGANAQMLIAQRAVGYFFTKPILCASILLSLIKNGKTECRTLAEELLYDPLLISYSGKLRTYLENLPQNYTAITAIIRTQLLQQDNFLKDLNEALELVELHPSNQRRRAVNLKNRNLTRKIMSQANKNSLLSHIAIKSTMLYGASNYHKVYTDEGHKTANTSLMSFSYSVEFPKLAIFDPIGIDLLIRHLKSGKAS